MSAAGVPGRLRVQERERAAESRLARDLERLLEVRLGLAGEADDDVGRDRGVRHRGADPVDDAEVAIAPVGPPHRLQYAVRAGLQRHVQLVHHVRRLGHRRDHVVGEVAGVRGREPHPLEPLDLPARTQQLAEREAVTELDAVRVDVLPQQRHLDDALGDERLTSARTSPGRRSCSVPRSDGTMQNVQVLLQPTRDRRPRRHTPTRAGRQRRREHLERLEDLDLSLVGDPCPLQQRRQRPDVVRTEHDVDPWRASDDRHCGPSAPGSRRRRSACPCASP